MSDTGDTVRTEPQTGPSEPRTTMQQFQSWAEAELERRRARDVDLDEGIFGEAVDLVVRRLAAKERGR